jgi:pyridoxal phosphate enzyme (YggS family)
MTHPEHISELPGRAGAVYDRICRAATRAGRHPNQLRLLLATKTQTPAIIRLYQDAFTALGAARPSLDENRSEEGMTKHHAPELEGSAWSMIGHVDASKVDELIAFASEIQSLDRQPLAEALERSLQKLGRSLDTLIQVRTSEENSKFGVPPVEVPALLRGLASMPALRVRGFMTRATNTTDEAEVRRCFRVLRGVQQRARQTELMGATMDVLSMGMSRDYGIAIEEGSTCLRLGEAVFGNRSFRPPRWLGGGGWIGGGQRSRRA